MILLFAQGGTALAGDSGWVGAGLLGLVLAWLLFWHLPGLQKQLTEILKMKDDQLAAKDARMEIQAKECEEEIARIANKFEMAVERVTARFDAELKEARKERESLLEFMRSRKCMESPPAQQLRAGG